MGHFENMTNAVDPLPLTPHGRVCSAPHLTGPISSILHSWSLPPLSALGSGPRPQRHPLADLSWLHLWDGARIAEAGRSRLETAGSAAGAPGTQLAAPVVRRHTKREERVGLGNGSGSGGACSSEDASSPLCAHFCLFLRDVSEGLGSPPSSPAFPPPFVLRRPRGIGGRRCATRFSAWDCQVPRCSAVGPAGLQATPVPAPAHSVLFLRLPGVRVMIRGILEAVALNLSKGKSQKDKMTCPRSWWQAWSAALCSF